MPTTEWTSPRSPGDVLAMLADRTPASATLHLTGVVITGTVLAVDGAGANRSVSLRPSNDNDAVIHVLIDRINAVVVHDVRRLSAPTRPREALSRLQWQRQLGDVRAQLEPAITVVIADDVADGDEDRSTVGAMLNIIPNIINTIVADDLGREALAEITTLQVTIGDQAEATVSGVTLLITVPRDSKLDLSATAWSEAISATL